MKTIVALLIIQSMALMAHADRLSYRCKFRKEITNGLIERKLCPFGQHHHRHRSELLCDRCKPEVRRRGDLSACNLRVFGV